MVVRTCLSNATDYQVIRLCGCNEIHHTQLSNIRTVLDDCQMLIFIRILFTKQCLAHSYGSILKVLFSSLSLICSFISSDHLVNGALA